MTEFKLQTKHLNVNRVEGSKIKNNLSDALEKTLNIGDSVIIFEIKIKTNSGYRIAPTSPIIIKIIE